MGLHADPGCSQESRASGRTIDGRAHLESPGSASGAESSDVMADVSASALGSDRGSRFLYDSGLDMARFGHVVFVLDLATRRVQVLGTTPHPNDAFMRQVVRTLSMAEGETWRVLICDRDAKWSTMVRERLDEVGIRVVQTPYEAPNANAFAERFVRSIKEECLNRIIPIGEGHFRRALTEYVAHYHRERNHQGLENALIEPAPVSVAGRVHRQSCLGGMLNFYRRAA